MRACLRYLHGTTNTCVSLPIIMWVHVCFVPAPTDDVYGTASFPQVAVFKDVRKELHPQKQTLEA